jgi:queuine tRNA-ribosyltransferase accessory subunit
LRRYIGLPEQCLSILGPRRVPSIPCPAHNTNSSIAISTSVGFRFLEVDQYHEAVKKLKADVSTGMADVIGTENASVKRIEKSADRTHAWLRDLLENGDGNANSPPLFASIPPVETELISLYLSDIKDEYRSQISGLCVYSPSTVPGLPETLRDIPTMYLSDPPTPQAILAAIHAGVDMLTVPFVTEASEHGISLSFEFPGSPQSPPKPLGLDLWSTAHATDLSPLSPHCPCYTCTRHHRAYVHHLLQASEMLAWTLLQIHNFRIINDFFASIRHSIDRGTFAADVDVFSRNHEPELPVKTGQGPRVRGYQMKSVGGGEPRKNPKAYGRLDEQMEKVRESQSGVAVPDGGAEDIEAHGLAEKV